MMQRWAWDVYDGRLDNRANYPFQKGAFTEYGGVQHFIQFHYQVQLDYKKTPTN